MVLVGCFNWSKFVVSKSTQKCLSHQGLGKATKSKSSYSFRLGSHRKPYWHGYRSIMHRQAEGKSISVSPGKKNGIATRKWNALNGTCTFKHRNAIQSFWTKRILLVTFMLLLFEKLESLQNWEKKLESCFQRTFYGRVLQCQKSKL